MQMPPALSTVLSLAGSKRALGSVEVPRALRILRPTMLALWLVVFAAQFQALVSGSPGNWFLFVLTTALFVGVYLHLWYEESELGRQFHRQIEAMRGHIYEDELTGLPNSRHFLFELRRQMMRSVRNGRGFSLVIAEVQGLTPGKPGSDEIVRAVARALHQGLGGGDFVGRLHDGTFAAIVQDDGQMSAAGKADLVYLVVGANIPHDDVRVLRPVASVTGYEGETAVGDFLRRAQDDFQAARRGARVVGGPVIGPAVDRASGRTEAGRS